MDYTKVLRMIEFLNTRKELVVNFHVGEKATEEEVHSIEKKIGYRLPNSFRKVLIEFSKKFEIEWEVTSNSDLKFKSGFLSWDLNKIIEFDKVRQNLNENLVENEEDEYDRLFLNKLPLMDFDTSNYVWFDLLNGEDARVVYFSHDGDYVGYVIADNFDVFLDDITNLGFVSLFYFDDFSKFTIHEDSGIIMNLDFTKQWIEELNNLK